MHPEQKITGVVKSGHRVASGSGEDSPYDRGTLEMQLPFFKQLGLDLSPYFSGTLNISIAPHTFEIERPKYTFKNVKWHPNYPAETFSFSPCQIIFNDISYSGLIYYPHPETKIGHFQDDSVLEVIALPIANIAYGDRVLIAVNPQEIAIC
ncbi:hypothetical protein [Myxosarcina sp. GI1]|uniref:hypothetical protein n=1 Tax=Myxosarcina sp. GI1 TaxID=1541065 RepID=UPI000569AA01|nr:hypothetical protein [Myxosarcina sp. GI1]